MDFSVFGDHKVEIIAAVFAIVVVAVIVFLVVSLRSNKGPSPIYIVGCLDSGKTKLFYQLTTKQMTSTVTSQSANKTSMAIKNKVVEIIDFPGHPRIRTQMLSAIRNGRAIIFVIDSETVLSKISEIANLLYDILSTEEVITKRTPVLVFCNKTDLHMARPVDMIKEELEREFQFIRENRQQSDFIENGETNFVFLGNEKAEFTFKQLTTNKVEFCSGSVNNDSTQDVLAFIERVI